MKKIFLLIPILLCLASSNVPDEPVIACNVYAGNFISAAATAETSVGFFVIN